ncbi:Clo7bot family Cys-rich peptide [Caloranaerobacter ferrireducens]|nr:Clo7bot family Cys-rich peptide [Caloranaerobacter ferrireducens]
MKYIVKPLKSEVLGYCFACKTVCDIHCGNDCIEHCINNA